MVPNVTSEDQIRCQMMPWDELAAETMVFPPS
jgi:hypothetical protein